MWGVLAALLSGALMSIQGVFNTQVTKQTSLWVSTGWVQFSAFLVCILAWLFTGRQSIGALWQIENRYTLLGGVIGILIGVAGAFGICSLIGFTAKVSAGTVLGASLFSSAVGIFFGIYPAKKAAKLSPIEALRHE